MLCQGFKITTLVCIICCYCCCSNNNNNWFITNTNGFIIIIPTQQVRIPVSTIKVSSSIITNHIINNKKGRNNNYDYYNNYNKKNYMNHYRKDTLLSLFSVIDPSVITTTTTAATTTAVPSISSSTMDPIVTFFLQTLITNGVPALFSIAVFGFIAYQVRSITNDPMRNRYNNNLYTSSSLSLLYDDLYGDQDQDPLKRNRPFNTFGSNSNNRLRNNIELPKNTGVPKLQYIKVTHLNPMYDSYKFSILSSTQSKAVAAAQYRQAAWERAWGKVLVSNPSDNDLKQASSSTSISLTPFQIQSLVQLEQEFLDVASKKQQEIQSVINILQRNSIDKSIKKLGMESVYQLDPDVSVTDTESLDDDNNNNNTTITDVISDKILDANITAVKKVEKMINQYKEKRDISKVTSSTMSSLQTDIINLELKFIENVIKTVGPTYAATIRTILLGNSDGLTQTMLSSGSDRPLTRLLVGSSTTTDNPSIDSNVGITVPIKKKVYVTRFPGDIMASQVDMLREEITAILQSQPRPNIDEVIVILQTGGGTVTGYGLAAAQLQRLKNANIYLTIAVEQVAASGGYMMACIADTIVASPFAVLGSIGVISEIPNVYDRLKTEGIEFQTVTAGKFKRTLTATKKVTKEDYQKTKEDIESIFGLFRDFVKENRPKLNIDEVATGETWFGTAALERNLCDSIQTVDDLLMNKIADGYDVYEVKYKPPRVIDDSILGQLLQPATTSSSETNDGPIRSMVRWLVRTIATEVKAELLSSPEKNKRITDQYMAVDDTSDRVRSQMD